MPEAVVITAIRPVARAPGRVAVWAGRRVIARVGADVIAELGLAPGATLDPEVSALLHEHQRIDEAVGACIKALARRSLSTEELKRRLEARGFERSTAEAAIARLEAQGAVSDARLALHWARAEHERKPAAAAHLAAKLERRGIDEATARRQAEAALAGTDAAEEALKLAAKRLKTMDPRVPEDVTLRRLFGVLARRGFDEETAEQAAAQALTDRARAARRGGRDLGV